MLLFLLVTLSSSIILNDYLSSTLGPKGNGVPSPLTLETDSSVQTSILVRNTRLSIVGRHNPSIFSSLPDRNDSLFSVSNSTLSLSHLSLNRPEKVFLCQIENSDVSLQDISFTGFLATGSLFFLSNGHLNLDSVTTSESIIHSILADDSQQAHLALINSRLSNIKIAAPSGLTLAESSEVHRSTFLNVTFAGMNINSRQHPEIASSCLSSILTRSTFEQTEAPFYGVIVPGMLASSFQSANNTFDTFTHNIRRPLVPAGKKVFTNTDYKNKKYVQKDFSVILGGDNSEIVMESCTFTNITTDSMGSCVSQTNGKTLTMKNNNFTLCTTTRGGGSVFTECGTFSISGGKLNRSVAYSSSMLSDLLVGGGMYLTSTTGTCTISGVHFYKCSADIGGALTLWTTATIAIKSCLFELCTATRSAAGMCIGSPDMIEASKTNMESTEKCISSYLSNHKDNYFGATLKCVSSSRFVTHYEQYLAQVPGDYLGGFISFFLSDVMKGSMISNIKSMPKQHANSLIRSLLNDTLFGTLYHYLSANPYHYFSAILKPFLHDDIFSLFSPLTQFRPIGFLNATMNDMLSSSLTKPFYTYRSQHPKEYVLPLLKPIVSDSFFANMEKYLAQHPLDYVNAVVSAGKAVNDESLTALMDMLKEMVDSFLNGEDEDASAHANHRAPMPHKNAHLAHPPAANMTMAASQAKKHGHRKNGHVVGALLKKLHQMKTRQMKKSNGNEGQQDEDEETPTPSPVISMPEEGYEGENPMEMVQHIVDLIGSRFTKDVLGKVNTAMQNGNYTPVVNAVVNTKYASLAQWVAEIMMTGPYDEYEEVEDDGTIHVSVTPVDFSPFIKALLNSGAADYVLNKVLPLMNSDSADPKLIKQFVFDALDYFLSSAISTQVKQLYDAYHDDVSTLITQTLVSPQVTDTLVQTIQESATNALYFFFRTDFVSYLTDIVDQLGKALQETKPFADMSELQECLETFDLASFFSSVKEKDLIAFLKTVLPILTNITLPTAANAQLTDYANAFITAYFSASVSGNLTKLLSDASSGNMASSILNSIVPIFATKTVGSLVKNITEWSAKKEYEFDIDRIIFENLLNPKLLSFFTVPLGKYDGSVTDCILNEFTTEKFQTIWKKIEDAATMDPTRDGFTYNDCTTEYYYGWETICEKGEKKCSYYLDYYDDSEYRRCKEGDDYSYHHYKTDYKPLILDLYKGYLNASAANTSLDIITYGVSQYLKPNISAVYNENLKLHPNEPIRAVLETTFGADLVKPYFDYTRSLSDERSYLYAALSCVANAEVVSIVKSLVDLRLTDIVQTAVQSFTKGSETYKQHLTEYPKDYRIASIRHILNNDLQKLLTEFKDDPQGVAGALVKHLYSDNLATLATAVKELLSAGMKEYDCEYYRDYYDYYWDASARTRSNDAAVPKVDITQCAFVSNDVTGQYEEKAGVDVYIPPAPVAEPSTPTGQPQTTPTPATTISVTVEDTCESTAPKNATFLKEEITVTETGEKVTKAETTSETVAMQIEKTTMNTGQVCGIETAGEDTPNVYEQPAAPPPPNPTAAPSDSTGLSTPVLIGIIAGAAVLVIVIIIVIVCVCIRRSHQKPVEPEPADRSTHEHKTTKVDVEMEQQVKTNH